MIVSHDIDHLKTESVSKNKMVSIFPAFFSTLQMLPFVEVSLAPVSKASRSMATTAFLSTNARRMMVVVKVTPSVSTQGPVQVCASALLGIS